jgi:hypothetical protein
MQPFPLIPGFVLGALIVVRAVSVFDMMACMLTIPTEHIPFSPFISIV